jgi:hypothetical protein
MYSRYGYRITEMDLHKQVFGKKLLYLDQRVGDDVGLFGCYHQAKPVLRHAIQDVFDGYLHIHFVAPDKHII